jgi:hypothetical protein
MKTLKVLSIAFLGLSLVFTGCKKEEEEEETSTMGSAVVKGIVTANLDLTNDTTATGTFQTQWEHPAGTKLIGWIDTKQLITNPKSGANYEKRYYEATVGADGSYSFTVDVNNNSVDLNISRVNFEHNTKKWKNINNKADGTITEREIYKMNEDKVVTVTRGATKIEDIRFNY